VAKLFATGSGSTVSDVVDAAAIDQKKCCDIALNIAALDHAFDQSDHRVINAAVSLAHIGSLIARPQAQSIQNINALSERRLPSMGSHPNLTAASAK